MFNNQGITIGLNNKITKYKAVVRKLLNKEELTKEEQEFIKKELE